MGYLISLLTRNFNNLSLANVKNKNHGSELRQGTVTKHQTIVLVELIDKSCNPNII